MTSLKTTETPEQVNYTKLGRLLLDGGSTALRPVFDGKHPPGSLAASLRTNKSILSKLTKPIKGKRGIVLSTKQWGMLFPKSGAIPNSKDFDITLLFVLLRNICGLTQPVTGWDALPPSTDTSLEANLVRIKFYRNNVIAHCSKAEIDDTQFEAYWKEISAALVSLGLKQDDIDDLKLSPLGTEEYNKLLKDWDLADHDVKHDMSDLRSVVTSGFTEVMKKIGSTSHEGINKLFHQEFISCINSKCDQYRPNTREWILQKAKSHIESTELPVAMIIQAGPGMGKSVLAAKICQLYREQGVLGACHFFEHDNSLRNDPRLLLQSVARQLCDSLPAYHTTLENKLDSAIGKDISNYSCKALFTLLFEEPCSKLTSERHLVIIIDALDECCNSLKEEFFDVLRNRLPRLPSWLRFVFTTRPPPSISSQLSGTFVEIKPNDPQNITDLQTFFTDKLKEDFPDQHDHHIKQLLDFTEGLILVAPFVIEYLTSKSTGSLTKAIEHFSLQGKGIYSVYKDYFTRIKEALKPNIESEEKFFDMLDAVVSATSPIEKNIFYDILGLVDEPRVPNRQRKEAINLLHQIFPVEHDHVSVFHKTVTDWLTSGDHDFVSKGDGNEVLANACYNVLMDIKQEISKQQHQPTLTDRETYALDFGLDYMQASTSFKQKKIGIQTDPDVFCCMAFEAVKNKNRNIDPFAKDLSNEIKEIYKEVQTYLGMHLPSPLTYCLMQEVTFLQCLEFTNRALNLLKIKAKERQPFDYLKENGLPYHESEILLDELNGKTVEILPCNDGWLLVELRTEHWEQLTSIQMYQLDGQFVSEVALSGHKTIHLSPDGYRFLVVAEDASDDIEILDAATLETVKSYKSPNLVRSCHVSSGSQTWYIVARCFDNKIYIMEGETGALVGYPVAVQQNEDIISVSKMGHILLARTTYCLHPSVEQRFADDKKCLCLPMRFSNISSLELFLYDHKLLGRKIPIYFRCLKCRDNLRESKASYPSVLFSEDGNLLAFYHADSITVVHTSDGSLYKSICLYHRYPSGPFFKPKMLFLSKARFVMQGHKSIFSYKFDENTSEAVSLEHIYFLPSDIDISFVSKASTDNIQELVGKRNKYTSYVESRGKFQRVDYVHSIEKYSFFY